MGNHWVTLILRGTRSNRCAIGARVKVSMSTPDGPRDVHVVVSTGGSFGSSSLQQEIGLGDATSIDQVEVIWPGTNERQLFTDVPMDRVVRMTEGQQTIERLDPPRVQLQHGHANGHAHHAAH
jgi:hypothetical protein